MGLPVASLPNPDMLLATTIAAAGLLVTWVQRRGTWRWSRAQHRLALIAAMAVLAVAWLSPLATVAGHYLLSAHLLQISLVMGVAAPLLLLALPRRPRITLPHILLSGLRVV